MPIYGYRCSSCGHELEVLQKMSDAPLKTCPNCGGELRKILYPAGVIFKGSGFYSTDYKGSKSSSDGASSSNGSAGSGADAKKSSEQAGEGAKPATESKAESKPSSSESKPSKSDSSE